MKPTIGRIVHYVTKFIDSEEACSRAAIVTGVEPDSDSEQVSLCVFHSRGIETVDMVAHDEDRKFGTWHWPPRE